MNIRKRLLNKKSTVEDISLDFRNHLIEVWTEDDVNYRDKKTVRMIYKELTMNELPLEPLFRIQPYNDDSEYRFYENGWVVSNNSEGSTLWILVDVTYWTKQK